MKKLQNSLLCFVLLHCIIFCIDEQVLKKIAIRWSTTNNSLFFIKFFNFVIFINLKSKISRGLFSTKARHFIIFHYFYLILTSIIVWKMYVFLDFQQMSTFKDWIKSQWIMNDWIDHFLQFFPYNWSFTDYSALIFFHKNFLLLIY